MLSPIIVIPARLAATRLPGKPLKDIGGVPMIVQVMRRAQEAALGPVLVAAGDAAIVDAVNAAGGKAVLTDPALPSGSDRIHAALAVVDPEQHHDVVVNLQGDLPTLDPALIQAVLTPMKDCPHPDIATLVCPIDDETARNNANIVKAVAGFADGADAARALYFSRAAVPFGVGPLYHHIGLYAWNRAALARFVALPPSVLEKRERLEQLRALEAGMTIIVRKVAAAPLGVDTPDDLARARAYFTTSTEVNIGAEPALDGGKSP